MKLISRGFGAIFFGAAFGLLHCGSSSNLGTPLDGGTGGEGGVPLSGTPQNHFPAGTTCRATRPAGQNNDDGGKTCDADAATFCACGSDAECTDGNNGRCIINGNAGPHCSYDACFASTDCATGSSCACGDIDPSSYNSCVPSNCRVDTDCGANGFCSPSYGTCGKFGGEYEGVYCHTKNDTCINDSDCTGNGSTNVGTGYCSYSTESNAWACSYTACAG
jgi:hypothetical protein